MTERQIENRVKKLQELEAQQKALEAEAEEIKNLLKAELEAQELEELKTKSFIIRWKEVVSSRLNASNCMSWRDRKLDLVAELLTDI